MTCPSLKYLFFILTHEVFIACNSESNYPFFEFFPLHFTWGEICENAMGKLAWVQNIWVCPTCFTGVGLSSSFGLRKKLVGCFLGHGSLECYSSLLHLAVRNVTRLEVFSQVCFQSCCEWQSFPWRGKRVGKLWEQDSWDRPSTSLPLETQTDSSGK